MVHRLLPDESFISCQRRGVIGCKLPPVQMGLKFHTGAVWENACGICERISCRVCSLDRERALSAMEVSMELLEFHGKKGGTARFVPCCKSSRGLF